VLAAVALVWAHRRRRHVRRPLSTGTHVSDPMPPAITHLRRGLRRRDDRINTAGAEDLSAYREFLDELRLADSDIGAAVSSDDGLDPADVSAAPDDTDLDEEYDEYEPMPAPPPVTPALANPIAASWAPAGVGLTGPGAESAARGFLIAALASGGADDPDARSWVVIPATTLATLLGAGAVSVPDTPRLTVTAGLAEALQLIEEQTLYRSRLLYDYEVDDATGLRDADPMAEPMPPLVLIADTSADHERARTAALLTQSHRLDIHGVLLGAWTNGSTVAVANDGTTTAVDSDARHGRHLADVGRLSILGPDEASDLLRLLGESHTGEAPRPEPSPGCPGPTEAEQGEPPLDSPGDAVQEDEDVPRTASANQEDAAPTDQSGTTPVETVDEPASVAAGRQTDEAVCTPVSVRLLGTPRIVNAPPRQRLRPQAVELLAYLAARGGVASQDDILDDVMPEMSARTAPHRLHTIVSNLRRIATLVGGTQPYVEFDRKQYRLNRAAFDIDLWTLTEAIRDAASTDDVEDRIAALRRAVAAYAGHFADAHRGYEWAETFREGARRQALDAALHLANALAESRDDPEEALTVINAAIEHHPHAEELCRAAIRLHATRGDIDAIRSAQRDLVRRLNDIDTDPSDETVALVNELITDLHRRQRVPGRSEGGQA
jgi:DNA-binding SARP family transcriptional activator